MRTGLPVPLGCICIRKDVSKRKESVESFIRQSISAAFENPKATHEFVRSKAQYLDDSVLEKHIYAFVNNYSMDISKIRGDLIKNLSKCAI